MDLFEYELGDLQNATVDTIVDVASSYPCTLCKKSFVSSQNLYRHQRSLHKVQPKYGGSLKCPERSCQYACSWLTEIRSHLRGQHGVQLEEIKLTFPSMIEFSKWREAEEKSSNSMFVATTSMKKLRDGSSRMYLSCHRSGSFKSKGVGKRKLKSQGSCKIDRCCPASMKVVEKPGMVIVHYFKTHCGHSSDLGDITHLRLTESERALIAGKLAQGVTFEHLLDNLQSSNHSSFNRFHLLTKKDLYNIQRNFKLQERFVAKEPETLESWLSKSLAQGPEQSPVLFCKDRGMNEEDDGMEGSLEAEDFLLVLASPLQRDMLVQFGSTAICIDYMDTEVKGHEVTREFALTTVVVVDEFNEPFPAAFCLSNRVDFSAFRRFFNALREKVGKITATVLVSDDFPALYGAWGQVMGEYKRHLLCPWYTEKCWKNLIAKIPRAKKVKKRLTLHRLLRTIMEIGEVDRFNEEIGTFLDEMMQDEDTGTFVSHFKNQFALRAEMWAHCFLGPNWTKIVGNLEATHRSLYHAFCQGKDFGHIVRCISSLNKLVRDRNCRRLAKTVNCKENGQDQTDSSGGVLVEVIEDDRHWWRLQNENGDTHRVERISKSCVASNCHSALNSCVHNYTCTCIDHLAFKRCQHIDMVRQLQHDESPVPLWEKTEQKNLLVNRVTEKVETLLGFLKKGRFKDTALNHMEQQLDSWLYNVKNENQVAATDIVEDEVQTVMPSNNEPDVVLLIYPPSANGKLPISRYKSPLTNLNKNLKNAPNAADMHLGFDHVY